MTDNPGQAAPGWYPDPSGAPRQRYFDGEIWTDHYHDEAAAGASPMGAAGGMTGAGIAQPALDPIGYWKKVVTENYSNFSGRARRAEYWWFALINFVVAIVLYGLAAATGDIGIIFLLAYVVFALAMFVPSLGVLWRRLHDTGKSGWFVLISLIPLVGSLILLVFMFTDGERGPNQYGPSPKY